jgi:mono/diheme cytochrome c family protein
MSDSFRRNAGRFCALVPVVSGAVLVGVICGRLANAAEPAATDPHAEGKAVYVNWCAACHDPGNTHPGTHALQAKYQGKRPAVILEWTDLPAEYVRYMVRHGMSVMPHFRKTEISDRELDALAAYLSRNTPGP